MNNKKQENEEIKNYLQITEKNLPEILQFKDNLLSLRASPAYPIKIKFPI